MLVILKKLSAKIFRSITVQFHVMFVILIKYVTSQTYLFVKNIQKKKGKNKMKMKKFFTGFTMLAFSALVLAACGSDEPKTTESSSTAATSEVASTESSEAEVNLGLKDGEYKLEEKNYSNGYRVVFTMTVEDGKIAKSDYDYVNEAGDSKKDDTEYETKMKDKTGVGPSEFIPKLNEEFVKAQNPGSVEVVTGATHSSDAFINYAQQLVQAAQAGDTETIEIDNGAEMKDGEYTLEEKNYSNGYRVVFSMTVEGGKIAKSNYDYVNEAGDSKKDDAEYETKMKDKTGVGPAEFIPQLNDALVEKQAAADVEVVTGATHSSHAFQMYAAQLINAAEKGDTTAIEVDNYVD